MTTPDPTTLPDPLVTFFVEVGKEAGKQIWGATAGRAKKEGGYALAARRYQNEIVKQYDQIHIYGPSQFLARHLHRSACAAETTGDATLQHRQPAGMVPAAG